MKPLRGLQRASPFFLQTDGAVTEECNAVHADPCEHDGKTQQKFCFVLCKYIVIVIKSFFMKVKINSLFLTPPIKEYTHTQAKVIRLFNDRKHALISSKLQLGLKLMTI